MVFQFCDSDKQARNLFFSDVVSVVVPDGAGDQKLAVGGCDNGF